MEKLKNVWLLLLLLVGMAACSDDDDNVQVTLSTREVKLEVTGGTTSFTVQTVGDWTIETDGQSWYTVSPQQGTGTTEVTVTAEASGEVASRSANLVVRSGSALATLVVTQTGTENPADPSNQTIKVRAKGGDREIVLPANEGYEVTIPTDADWVKLKEKKSGSVVLTLAANEAGDHYRTAAVTVSKTDGSHLATLNLSQSWRNVEPGELLFQEVFLTSNLIAETGKTDSRNMEQYFILTNNTDEELEIENPFILSPKDLCTIDFLDRFIGAGVRVLKIEGRARSAEYVHRVVSCYHEALIALEQGNYTPERIAVWKARLSEVFNRGFWGGYYLGGKTGEWSQVYGSSATKRKVYVGKVTNFFKKISVAEIQVEAAPLSVGEEAFFMGETTGVQEFTVEEIRVAEQPVSRTVQGETCSIPTRGLIRRGDRLYKFVEASETDSK